MQPTGALPSLVRLRQGLWHTAPVGAWELASFSLLLSALVQEVSPQCPLPLQGPSSLGGAGAVGVWQLSGRLQGPCVGAQAARSPLGHG